jgi:hypothetical protein
MLSSIARQPPSNWRHIMALESPTFAEIILFFIIKTDTQVEPESVVSTSDCQISLFV